MLNAIAIYIPDEIPGSFKRDRFAINEKKHFGLFPSTNDLDEIEKISLPHISHGITDNQIYHYQVNGNHHYLAKIKGDSFIVAISSKKPLTGVELNNLVRNIGHAYFRPEVVGVAMDDILANWINYIGKDLLLSKTQQKVDEAEKMVLKTIHQAVDRGNQIDKLHKETIIIRDNARDWERSARRTNACCR